MKNILFVCAGNTCRSPMAEALTNAKYSDGFSAKSAGLYGFGSPINEKSFFALLDYGIFPREGNRFDAHRSKTVTKEMIHGADRVIALDGNVFASLIAEFPFDADRITVFDPEIPDPYGGSAEFYRETLRKIEEGLKNLLHE